MEVSPLFVSNFGTYQWPRALPKRAFRFESAIFVSFLSQLSAIFRRFFVRNARCSLYRKWRITPSFFLAFFGLFPTIFGQISAIFRFFLSLYDIAGQA